MNDHETTDAAYRRLLEVARARLKNHPDLLRSFENEHARYRVCGFVALLVVTEGPSMLDPDARLCRIVDEWVQAWKQRFAAGRPIRVQPLDARPEQTASPAPSASTPVAAPAEAVPAEREDAAATTINTLPKAQWKLPRSNRWTEAAKGHMRAMRATHNDAQIAKAFELKHARQVGNLIGSRSENRSR